MLASGRPVGEDAISRSRRARSTLVVALLFCACAPILAPVAVKLDYRAPKVSWLRDVKPVLDRRCVVCHSCYNAPCQLKLGAYEGVDRGGSKQAIYDTSRLTAQAPTRLFVDASTTAAWRAKGFHSVTDNPAAGDFNDSLLMHLLEAKRMRPQSEGVYEPEAGLTCAASQKELGAFLARHPERGMPFGLPALSPEEHALIATWLQQGAQGPTPEEQEALTAPSPGAAAEIAKWEAFLNRDDAKHHMTARYLYEHYFLAHIHFGEAAPDQFFELLRSKTPPGEPIEVVATVRPYDDPGTGSFWYRFRRVHETIVHKTHMVVELDDERLERIRAGFIETEWLEPPHRVGFEGERAANPFLVYAQIPPEVRYRFLLDHSEYVLRTFIRGPVCKGQVALNVIHDHFWVLFLDPDADPTVQSPDFLVEQASKLRLPTEEGSEETLLRTFSNRYRERYRAFYQKKAALYSATRPEGRSLADVWKGERATDAPLLTVYRHFDSASVHRGALGDLPRTLWVIDYPQFERIYYALVAGFDVFGNLSHQVNVRRYMDYLRIEGELNFLSFLPQEVRLPLVQSWYLGDRAIENVDPDAVLPMPETGVRFATQDPKRELLERLVEEHFAEGSGIAFDPINYRPDGREVPMPTSFSTYEDVLQGLRALTAPGTGFIRHVTDTEANVLLVRVRSDEGPDQVFTIVINRWHDNVNSMFGEAETLDPSKDEIDFLVGSIGSYPNYFLDVAVEDVPDLFDLLANFDGSDAYLAKLDRYGVNRAESRFWDDYDWFQRRLDEADPVETGLYDLNRYYRVAIP
jgi:hypothetical protein